MRREPAALVALALSACTAVTTVRVTPDQLQTLAGMGPDEERIFTAVDVKETQIARGDDDIRLRVTPVGQERERNPSVQQEPWGKLYTLRWGASVSLTLIDHRSSQLSLSLPATDVTGAELQMSRFSGWKTAGLVLCIIGSVVVAALIGVVIIGAANPAGG